MSRDEWKDEHDEIEDRLSGRRSDRIIARDPWAIAAVLMGFLLNVGIGVWWSSKLDSRVQVLERTDAQRQQDDRSKVNIDAVQTSQIAVLDTKLTYIQNGVDTLNRKISERAQ